MVSHQQSINGSKSVVVSQWQSVSGSQSVLVSQWESVSGSQSVVACQWQSVSGNQLLVVSYQQSVSGSQSLVVGHQQSVSGSQSLGLNQRQSAYSVMTVIGRAQSYLLSVTRSPVWTLLNGNLQTGVLRVVLLLVIRLPVFFVGYCVKFGIFGEELTLIRFFLTSDGHIACLGCAQLI